MFNSTICIPDVQNDQETRGIVLDHVGIKDLRHPFRWKKQDGSSAEVVGNFFLDILLPSDKRGTHMSRFIEILGKNQIVFDVPGVWAMAGSLLDELDAKKGRIGIRFPFFLTKCSPISTRESFLDYDVYLKVSANRIDQKSSCEFATTLSVRVPVTSLCPCSKRISKYGAHNQRSIVTISVELSKPMDVEDLIRIAEGEASCELFSVLKREDEKAVTERAYENAKFVEDVARDIALQIRLDQRIVSYIVEVENFESIHNHSAYACVKG